MRPFVGALPNVRERSSPPLATHRLRRSAFWVTDGGAQTLRMTSDDSDPLPELTEEQVARLRSVPSLKELEETDPTVPPRDLEARAIDQAVSGTD